MADITELRREIDGVDSELVRLYLRRMETAAEIGAYKRQNGLPVYDPQREAQLLERVRIDDLYFRASGGGITFGGGEPLLRSAFIRSFCELAPREWNITLETSLHVPRKHLEEVLPFVGEYFIDVKDMSPDIYRRYTLRSNRQTIQNLQWLADKGLQERVVIRLPRIPDYNTGWDVRRSRKALEAMGYTRFDCFTYIKDVEDHKRRIR